MRSQRGGSIVSIPNNFDFHHGLLRVAAHGPRPRILTPMSWYQQTHWRILVALGIGLIYGVVAALNGWGDFTSDWIAPFGAIFLRLLLLIAVPLVLASLINGVASLSDLTKLSRIGGKTIAIYPHASR